MNELVHEFLLKHGYVHQHIEADWEDVGGPETGPIISGHGAFDEYTSNEDFVYIDDNDKAYFEPRDLAFEKYVNSFAFPGSTE